MGYTYQELKNLVEFYQLQVEELLKENEKLRNQTTNISEALANSNSANAELSTNYNDAVEALNILGVDEDVEE